MATIVLALAAAALYGLSDFAGGLVSRRTSVWGVAVVTQITAAVALGVLAFVQPSGPTRADLAWGALAGVGTGIGTGFLYRGLSAGRMGVVAPLSAVGAALLPVIVGIATGERPQPLTLIGIACAFPAIWLVSTSTDTAVVDPAPARPNSDVANGLLAGLGFGLMFSALGQVPESAGLAPLAMAELSSIAAVVVLAMALRQSWLPANRAAWNGVVVGALAAAATVCFLFASQSGLLAVASVLASLYPAVTVLLATLVLHERIHRGQGVGLGLTLVAVVLVAAN